MPWVFAVVMLVLIVALALVVSGRLPQVPQPTERGLGAQLPDRPTAADVDALRLPVVLRGYRMEEVDAALAVLRDRLAELESTKGTSNGRTQPATER